MTEMNKHRPTRRSVLAGALAGAAAFPRVLPASAVGKGHAVAPSERIALGFIGIGMMGSGHLLRSAQYEDTQVCAICDVDSWRREHALAAVKRIYRERFGKSYRGLKAYRDLRDLLQRDDIDAVFIATGDRWHVPAGCLAVKAGKDVYCEKPMSLTINEALTMVQVTRRYNAVFQVGLQQRSDPVFRFACRCVQKGVLGKLKTVYVAFPGTSIDVNLPPEPVPEGLDWDLWLGPAPWRPFNGRFHHYGQPRFVVPWHFCVDFGGGNLTSNAVHAFDVVQWALGMDGKGPIRITPPGVNGAPSLTYEYENGVLLLVDWKLDPAKHEIPRGWNPETRLQPFGALYVGEKGWIHVGRRNFFQYHPPSLIDPASVPRDTGNSVVRHHRNWFQAIRSRKRPACDVSIGCTSTIVSHLGCIAHWTGRVLRWDPKEARFLGDEQADRMRIRAKRSPWRL